MIYNFFDTETTGLNRNFDDEVIQIGGLITDINLNPLKAYCFNVDTTKGTIPEAVTRVNHLTMDILHKTANNVFLEQIMSEKLPEFYAKDIIFVCYNKQFDQRIVNQTIKVKELKVDFGTDVIPPIIPVNGRHSIEMANFYSFINSNRKRIYKKLSSLSKPLQPAYDKFLSQNQKTNFETNLLPEMLGGIAQHNSLYDSIMVYLLFKRDIWKTKLIP